MAAYTNGSTLSRKVRSEVTQIGECMRSRDSSSAAELVLAWQECTTRACNWMECVVGAGLYAPQTHQFLAHFPSDRFLLLEEEQLLSQPGFVASSLSAFLELHQPILPGAILALSSNHSRTP